MSRYPHDPDEPGRPAMSDPEALAYEETICMLAREPLVAAEYSQIALDFWLEGRWPHTQLAIRWRRVHTAVDHVGRVPIWAELLLDETYEPPNVWVGNLIASWAGERSDRRATW